MKPAQDHALSKMGNSDPENSQNKNAVAAGRTGSCGAIHQYHFTSTDRRWCRRILVGERIPACFVNASFAFPVASAFVLLPAVSVFAVRSNAHSRPRSCPGQTGSSH